MAKKKTGTVRRKKKKTMKGIKETAAAQGRASENKVVRKIGGRKVKAFGKSPKKSGRRKRFSRCQYPNARERGKIGRIRALEAKSK